MTAKTEITIYKYMNATEKVKLQILGSIHSSLAAMSAFINKNKTPQPIAKGFLGTLAASVNICGCMHSVII